MSFIKELIDLIKTCDNLGDEKEFIVLSQDRLDKYVDGKVEDILLKYQIIRKTDRFNG